jgi:hypothetical protein
VRYARLFGVAMLACLSGAPAPLRAQAALPDADRIAMERIDVIVRDFDRRGLPTELLRAKVAEGTAKGASPNRIADAVTLLATRVDSVARLLAPSVTVPELHAGAEALSVGITGLSLRTIRAAVGRQSAEPYFQFVVRLVRRGVTQEQAVRATRALIDRRVASNTLLAVADDLARDVANGVAPDAALNDRMTRLVGGTPGAANTAGTANGPTRGLAGPLSGNRPP